MFAIAWSQGFEDAWSKVAQGAPKVVYFAVVLLVGLFIARVLGRIVTRLLDRVGAPAAADRIGVSPHLNRAGFTLSTLGGRAVKLFVTFVAITTAFAVFGAGNPVSTLIDDLVAYLPKVFVAAVIVVITGLIARWAGETLKRLMAVSEGATSVDMPDFLPKLAVVAIWVVGSFAALDQLEIAPAIVQGVFYAALAAIVGVVIVAVGGGGIASMRSQWERVLDRNAKPAARVDLTERAEWPAPGDQQG
jgi:hypothetical protein